MIGILGRLAAATAIGFTLVAPCPADASAVLVVHAPASPFDIRLTAPFLRPDPSMPPSTTLTFPHFDPSLGTLHYVLYDLSGSVTLEVATFVQLASPGTTLDVLMVADARFDGPGVAGALRTSLRTGCSEVAGSCSAADSAMRDAAIGAFSPVFLPIPFSPSFYVGSGTVDIDLRFAFGLAEYSCSGSAAICAVTEVVARWAGSLDLRYVYEPAAPSTVGAPATLALFGLAGAVALRGRRPTR